MINVYRNDSLGRLNWTGGDLLPIDFQRDTDNERQWAAEVRGGKLIDRENTINGGGYAIATIAPRHWTTLTKHSEKGISLPSTGSSMQRQQQQQMQ